MYLLVQFSSCVFIPLANFQDSTISKLTREIETLKKELREKEGYVSTMTAKVNKLKDAGKSTEERDAREKELISLRQVNTENKWN